MLTFILKCELAALQWFTEYVNFVKRPLLPPFPTNKNVLKRQALQALQALQQSVYPFFFFFLSKLLNANTIYREWIRGRLEENLDQGALKFGSEKGLSRGQDLKSRTMGSVLTLLCLCASQEVIQHPHTASHQPSLQGWEALVCFSIQWALIFTSICESHSNTNNFLGKFIPNVVPGCYPDTALTLGSPARAVPPLCKPQLPSCSCQQTASPTLLQYHLWYLGCSTSLNTTVR